MLFVIFQRVGVYFSIWLVQVDVVQWASHYVVQNVEAHRVIGHDAGPQ